MGQLIFPITKKEAEKSGVAYSSQANKDALFPSRLRELREEKGISQAVLSQILGVSKSTVGLWETGDTIPDARAIHDMAEYFGVSADYMLDLSPAKSLTGDIKVAEYTTGLSKDAIYFLNLLSDGSAHYGNCLKAINAVLSEREAYDCIKYWENIFLFLFHPDNPFEALMFTGTQKRFSAENVLRMLLSENEQYLLNIRRKNEKEGNIKKAQTNKKKKTASGAGDAESGQ